jgi:hypothetical protein
MPTPREAYTNSVERQGYSGARLRAADFGSAGEMIARAGQQAGQALGQAADSLLAIQKEDAKTLAQEADNMRLAKRLQYFYDGDNGFFNKQGKDAVLAAQNVPGDLKKIDDEVAGQLLKTNGWARKMYDEVTARRNNDDLPKIYQHTAVERKKHEDAVFGAAFDLAIDNASNSLDPKIIEENIATVGNLAVNKMIREGEYDTNLLEQTRQTAIGKAVAGVAKRLEQKSPGEAQAFVVSHASLMDPQDVGQLLDAIAPAAAQEGAWNNVDNYLVLTSPGQQANAPTTTTSPTGGNAAPTPIPSEAALDAAQFTGPGAQEGAASHTDRNGNLIRSPAGAQGISQIMPANLGSKGFGYGVVPPRDNSRAEYLRAGRDYRKALLKKYDGNITLALTAYNWGPGNVDAQIAKVGDPRKGQISDAAFVNSIPAKEAREYAPSILQRVGVTVAGAASRPDQTQAPTYAGQEINLEATIDRIQNDPELTWPAKQALIAAASQKHGLGRAAKAEAESRVTDSVWTQINTLGDKFTSFEQLPLDLRTQLKAMPQQEAAFRNMAEANARAVQAAADQRQDAITQQAELDLQELQYVNPQKFASIDLRTDPTYSKMTTAKLATWMARQEDVRKSQQGGTNISYDKVRTAVNRFASKDAKKDEGFMGFHYNEAIKRAEALARQTGKPLDDAQYEAIASDVLTPVVANIGGKERTETKAQVQSRLKPGQVVTVRLNPYEEARIQLKKRFGREPLQQEIDAAIALRNGGR